MKSLSNYVFELKDETYFKLAKKRKEQGKDISDIISHANGRIFDDFINELTSRSWYKEYVKNAEYSKESVIIKLVFDGCMHDTKGSSTFKEERNNMRTSLISLSKKYGRLVHGVRFLTYYANEEPHALIYLLNRKEYLKDIDKNTLLYHITTDIDIVNKIIDNGIIPVENKKYNDYTYNCVFAFKSKKFIDLYRKKYLNVKKYYIIEFEAGDNIYFPDWMLNMDLIRDLQFKTLRYDDEITKRASQSIFTLSKIDKEQIVSITEVSGKNKNIIYERK